MYIVIEKHSDPIICTDEDGNTLYFTTKEEAQKEADDCQDGMIINLDGMVDADEFEQYRRESIKWSVEDFMYCNCLDGDPPRCTEEQAQDLLEKMIRKHDATMGICWETLEYWLSTLE